MRKKITVTNYKAFSDKTEIEIAPLNLIFGPNSSGKTSILHLLLLLKQTFNNSEKKDAIKFNDVNLDLGNFEDVINNNQKKKTLSIKIDSINPSKLLHPRIPVASTRQFSEFVKKNTCSLEMEFKQTEKSKKVYINKFTVINEKNNEILFQIESTDIKNNLYKYTKITRDENIWESMINNLINTENHAFIKDQYNSFIKLVKEFPDLDRLVKFLIDLSSKDISLRPNALKYFFDAGTLTFEDAINLIKEDKKKKNPFFSKKLISKLLIYFTQELHERSGIITRIPGSIKNKKLDAKIKYLKGMYPVIKQMAKMKKSIALDYVISHRDLAKNSFEKLINYLYKSDSLEILKISKPICLIDGKVINPDFIINVDDNNIFYIDLKEIPDFSIKTEDKRRMAFFLRDPEEKVHPDMVSQFVNIKNEINKKENYNLKGNLKKEIRNKIHNIIFWYEIYNQLGPSTEIFRSKHTFTYGPKQKEKINKWKKLCNILDLTDGRRTKLIELLTSDLEKNSVLETEFLQKPNYINIYQPSGGEFSSLIGKILPREKYSFNILNIASINDFIQGIITNNQDWLKQIFYLSSFRTTPSRTHIYSGSVAEDVGFWGEKMAEILYICSQTSEGRKQINLLNKTLKEQEIPHSVEVVKGKNISGIYEIRVKDTKSGAFVNWLDIGHGILRYLPFLFQTILSQNKLLISEESESNFHPRLIEKFSEMVVKSMKAPNNNQFIFETHSEHFVLALQKLIRQGKLKPEEVNIYYCHKVKNKGAKLIKIKIDDKGRFITKWPEGFFPERYNLIKDSI